MNENNTRRQIMKSITGGGALTVIAGTGAAIKPNSSVRVIEAGVRYEIDGHIDAVRAIVNSRPPYTVDQDKNNLVFTSGGGVINEADTNDMEVLVDETVDQRRGRSELRSSGRKAMTLPTALSARMRVKEGVQLSSDHKLPTVVVHWNPKGAAANVQSIGKVDIPQGSHRAVRLEPETVEVRTATSLDEKADIDGIPEEMRSPKLEYDSVQMQATPVVEFVDHGRLSVKSVSSAI